MLDIGFSEIALIFGLALVVLGPEKLPRVASQVGRWIGRARGMARQFREQLEEEVNLEETRKASKPASVTQSAPPAASVPAVPVAQVSPAPAASVDPVPLPAATTAEAASQLLAQTQPPAQSQPLAQPQPSAESPEQQITYPDTFSHAHPTDSLGRAIEAPTNEPAAVDSGQQDWVGVPTGHSVPAGDGGVSPDKPAETPPAAAYAPSHERGT
jgi:sec-independent protein translocase protein TatB